MKDKGLGLAIEHLRELESRNPDFIGGVIFCKKAKEYVVKDLIHKIHFHIVDNDNVCDWEQDLVNKHKELVKDV